MKDRSQEQDRKLIQDFASAIDKSFLSTSRLISRSFLAGIFSGLGATIGASVVILLLGLVLSRIPFIGRYISMFLHPTSSR